MTRIVLDDGKYEFMALPSEDDPDGEEALWEGGERYEGTSMLSARLALPSNQAKPGMKRRSSALVQVSSAASRS